MGGCRFSGYEGSQKGCDAQPRLRIGNGTQAVERLLFHDLEGLLRRSVVGDPARRRPVLRIVVPSRSLRLHLAARLLRHLHREGGPGALLGVRVQTLNTLARQVVQSAGQVPLAGAGLWEIVVRRAAADEPALHDVLGHLLDGYAAVAATVSDLLNAGLEGSLSADLVESLEGGRRASDDVDRASALLRVAATTTIELQKAGRGRAADVFRQAAKLITRDPSHLAPMGNVLIHGFTEATGLASMFIAALFRQGAVLYLNLPPDPAQPERLDRSVVYGRRLTERVGGSWSLLPSDPGFGVQHEAAKPHLSMFKAAGSAAEVREVANRIGLLLEDGVVPEGIGVVCRDLAPYQVALRTQFTALGVPFSGIGAAGFLSPFAKRIHALIDVLQEGTGIAAERWLAADANLGDSVSKNDLRLAFHTLGAARLESVARLDVDRLLPNDGEFRLPVCQGLTTRQSPARRDGEINTGDIELSGQLRLDLDLEPVDSAEVMRAPTVTASRRRIQGSSLAVAVGRARTLNRLLLAWPGNQPPGAAADAHLEALQAVMEEGLGWRLTASPDDANSDAPRSQWIELGERLRGLRRELAGELRLLKDEFVLLATRTLLDGTETRLGGDGGGVQVLGVMEARARTFEHLFVLGMNRDLFPRSVREDPLFRDRLRRRLLPLLPDLPIKKTGLIEERYLFAQLMSSSRELTISWQTVDDDGNALAASPLVERLLLSDGCQQPEAVQHPASPLSAGSASRDRVRTTDSDKAASRRAQLRTSREHAILAALGGHRRWFSEALKTAMSEAPAAIGPGLSKIDASQLTAARLAILDEMDPDLSSGRTRQLGPYFGFIGSTGEAADPRRGELFISSLENLAACPWQTLLTRFLRVEPVADPWEELPAADPRLVGIVVHRVLERIVCEARRREVGDEPAVDLDVLTTRVPVSIGWPAAERLSEIVLREAKRVTKKEGIGLAGFDRMLAERARPFVLRAYAAEGGGDSWLEALGVEVTGSLRLRYRGGRRTVRFRADLVDRREGEIRLTDYKTGRPISASMQDSTRRQQLLRSVLSGRHLQAVAYQMASGSTGRFLFLTEHLPEEARSFTVQPGDDDLVDAFGDLTHRLFEAIDRGVLFPRLVDSTARKEPDRCGFCPVASACLRGDSGARSRLCHWVAEVEPQPDGSRRLTALEHAMWQLWELPRRRRA